MELEQRIQIKSLQFKGLKLLSIHSEFVLVFDEEAYTLGSRKH
jgi:hypothetical protein